jgi:hypothetical protein
MIMTIFLKMDKVKKSLKIYIQRHREKQIKFSWDYPFKVISIILKNALTLPIFGSSIFFPSI